MSEWVNCSDEPVPKTKKVLALDIDGDMAVVWHNTQGFVRGYWGDSFGGGYDYFEPIAWMPLPEPPND